MVSITLLSFAFSKQTTEKQKGNQL